MRIAVSAKPLPNDRGLHSLAECKRNENEVSEKRRTRGGEGRNGGREGNGTNDALEVEPFRWAFVVLYGSRGETTELSQGVCVKRKREGGKRTNVATDHLERRKGREKSQRSISKTR